MHQLEMSGKAQHLARPAQTRLQNAGMFAKFLADVRRRFIGGVNAHVAILPSVVECHAHRLKLRYANFRRFARKIGYHSNVS